MIDFTPKSPLQGSGEDLSSQGKETGQYLLYSNLIYRRGQDGLGTSDASEY